MATMSLHGFAARLLLVIARQVPRTLRPDAIRWIDIRSVPLPLTRQSMVVPDRRPLVARRLGLTASRSIVSGSPGRAGPEARCRLPAAGWCRLSAVG